MPEEIVKQRLADIKARADRATPGPWTTRAPGIDAETGFQRGCIVAATAPSKSNRVYADPPGGSFPADDQDFIAAAREDVPWLVARLEAALAREAALVQIGWGDGYDGVDEIETLDDFALPMCFRPVRRIYAGPNEWVVGVPINDAGGDLEDVEAHVFATEDEAAAFIDSLKAEAAADPAEDPRD